MEEIQRISDGISNDNDKQENWDKWIEMGEWDRGFYTSSYGGCKQSRKEMRHCDDKYATPKFSMNDTLNTEFMKDVNTAEKNSRGTTSRLQQWN